MTNKQRNRGIYTPRKNIQPKLDLDTNNKSKEFEDFWEQTKGWRIEKEKKQQEELKKYQNEHTDNNDYNNDNHSDSNDTNAEWGQKEKKY